DGDGREGQRPSWPAPPLPREFLRGPRARSGWLGCNIDSTQHGSLRNEELERLALNYAKRVARICVEAGWRVCPHAPGGGGGPRSRPLCPGAGAQPLELGDRIHIGQAFKRELDDGGVELGERIRGARAGRRRGDRAGGTARGAPWPP